MPASETRKGELAILASTFLWGLTPIVIIFSYVTLSPLVSLAFVTLFAAVFFGAVLTINKNWGEFSKPAIFKYLFIIALCIGILYYSLYFFGLKTTTPGNASLILLMETFFSYLLFIVWKKEQYGASHIFGSLLMVLGAAFILFHNFSALNRGDVLILLATMFAPLGNYYQQILRKKISSAAILFGRSIITAPFIFILAFLFREHIAFPNLQKAFWILLISGFLLLGLSKILWIEGIHRISVTKAAALESIGPLFTLFFAYIFLRQAPTVWQLSALIPLSAGLVLLTKRVRQ